jgi:hypothetical protein
MKFIFSMFRTIAVIAAIYVVGFIAGTAGGLIIA